MHLARLLQYLYILISLTPHSRVYQLVFDKYVERNIESSHGIGCLIHCRTHLRKEFGHNKFLLSRILEDIETKVFEVRNLFKKSMKL